MPLHFVALDTATLPPEQQFASWAAHSGNSRLSPIRPGPFLARGRYWTLGPAHLSEFLLDPFLSDRTPELVRSAPASFVQLVALDAGEVRFEADGRDELCRAPDLFIRDYARPSRATSGRIRAIIVYLARDFLEEASGAVTFQGRLPLSPQGAILGAALRTIVAELPHIEAEAAGLYARVLRDLATAALLRPHGAATRPGRDSPERLRRAKAAVAAKPPGSVTAAALAAELGVSRSVLFQLFRPHGGVMAYDRLRRLRALYRDLSNPAEHRSVAELGAGHGFLDKSALARGFRGAFGRSPTEVRHAAQVASGVGTDGAPAHVVLEAIRNLD